MAHLAHKQGLVREGAVGLLAHIGSPAEASAVVALLSDDVPNGEWTIPFAAAKTLAAIGGPRELVAFDAWLATRKHRPNSEILTRVRGYRDQLKARLDKHAEEQAKRELPKK